MANENDTNFNQSDVHFLEEVSKILETVRKPFIILETDGRVLFLNQRFCNTYEIAPEQMAGHTIFSALDGEWDIPDLRHLLNVALAEKDLTEDDYEIDHIFPRFGHKIMRINGQRSFFRTLGRQVLLLSIEDYTKRKLQEQKLFESEERFRRMFETSSDGLLLATKDDGTIIEVNAALCEMLGIGREEIVGKSLVEAGIAGREYNLQHLLERLTGKGSFAFDSVLVNVKSSLPFPAQVTFTDRSAVIQANVRDISKRIQEKDLLQKTAQEWLATFNAVPDLITRLDPDMRILRSNDAFRRYFSIKPGESRGQFCYDFFNEHQGPCPGCPVTSTLQDHKLHSAVITHAGLGKKFQVTSAPILSENMELLGIIQVARDITDLEKLEQQLRQAQKMEAIGSLAGGIAHDLNNILFPISGLSEMLLEDIPEDNHWHENVGQIHKSAKRGSDLVKQILAFARQSNPQKLPIRIQPILKEVVKLARATIPMNIDIESLIDSHCGTVSADPTQFYQIAMNLITNASHALEDTGGTIRVGLKESMPEKNQSHDGLMKSGKYACMTISDTGTGIDQSLLHKIFEPYFTTKSPGKGAGLGLSVVHGIVKEHDGDIQVVSEIGKGTAFQVYLPLMEDGDDKKMSL